MIKIFEEARGFIKDKRYNKISDTMIDVGKNNVALTIHKGRSILTCSCSNSGRFADNNLCSHKIVFLIINFNENLYKEIDKSISLIENYRRLHLETYSLMCLDFLENIKKAE